MPNSAISFLGLEFGLLQGTHLAQVQEYQFEINRLSNEILRNNMMLSVPRIPVILDFKESSELSNLEKEIKDLNMSSQQTGEKIDIYGINGLYGDILKNRVSMGYEEEKLSFDDWLVHGNIIPSETCNHEWKEVELFVSKKTYCTKCDMEKK